MSQINVNNIEPQSGTTVDVNGIIIKDTTNASFVLYGGSDFTPNTSVGSNTTIVGSGAMVANTGNSNTAIGANTLRSNTSGINNTGLGTESLFSNTTGNGNTAVGKGSLYSVTTGTTNTAIGSGVLPLSNGIENVCVGGDAGFSMTTGSFNVIVGTSSGSLITTGNNNICVGDDTQTATPTTSNSITLGNGSHNILRCAVTSITSLSDGRDKKDVEDLPVGLSFIKTLKPVKFVWDERDENGKHNIKDFGFIAQDLKSAQEEYGVDDILKLVYEENPDKLEASYGKLIPILVKAIQELSDKVKMLENK
jgi:hypothetical protein